MKPPSSDKNRSCAELLLATLYALFPNTITLESQSWPWGFSVECIMESPLNETILPSVVTHMKRMVKSGMQFEHFSMMRKNAIAFFEEKGLSSLVYRLEVLQQDVVELCKIGDFYDIALFDKEDEAIDECILQDIEVVHTHYLPFGDVALTRIYGAAFDSKEQKKFYIKNIYNKISVKKIAEDKKLLFYRDDRLFLEPRGMALWNLLRQKITPLLASLGYQEVLTPRYRVSQRRGVSLFGGGYSDTAFLQLLSSAAKVYEWGEFEETSLSRNREPLYDDSSVLSCRFHSLCPHDELPLELTSLLKIFSEIARMLGLECSAAVQLPQNSGRKYLKVAKDALLDALARCSMIGHESIKKALVGPKIDLQVLDFRGRLQTIATLGIDLEATEQKQLKELAAKPYLVIGGALPSSFGRVLALLLERNDGFIPLI